MKLVTEDLVGENIICCAELFKLKAWVQMSMAVEQH